MKKGLWKKLILVLLPLAALGLMAALDPQIAQLNDVLKAISPYWFLAAVGCMLAYYFFDSLMYLLACRYMQIPQRLGEGLLTTMVGFFYSALTPFSSGGQPMQVLQMRRRGVPVGAATSVLILKFLAWQLAVTLLGVLGFLFLGGELLQGRVSVLVMYIVGFCLFLGSVVLAGLAFFRPDWIHRIGERILNFLTRKRFLRKPERIRNVHVTWSRTIREYGDAMHFALEHKLGMLLIFLVAALEALAYMAITYFIYRGLGFDTYGLWHIVLLQGLLYISVSFVPLPGASIASEGGFYLVFSKLFTDGARFPAVLLWRLLTYYSALLLGLVAVIIDGLRNPVARQQVVPVQRAVQSVPSALAQALPRPRRKRKSTVG